MTTRRTKKMSTSATARAPEPQQSTEDPLVLDIDGLRYVLDTPPKKNGKKVIINVRPLDGDDAARFVDRCDLYGHRARSRLAAVVAETFGRSPDDVFGHLTVLLDQVERAIEVEAATPAVVVVTETQRLAAEKLLAQGDLLDRVAKAMEALGHVGEDRNKRLCYLAATSRLMANPLNVLLMAPPGTGKSSVLDALVGLMPPESVVSLTRLAPMSLYYMGEHALRHKLVVVDEYEGQAEADHAVRVLQSRGELRVSVTVQGKAQSLVVKGPVAVMSGTVSSTIDRQNASRCLELTLDDSAEQTKRVQEAQARRAAGHTGPRVDLQPLVDAQRLLEPIEVVVPFAPKLSFPSRSTADRRASAKLLALIQSHALLHQRQRERDKKGRLAATVDDYAAVHALLAPLVEREVEGLSDRAARTHALLVETGAPLTKREIATAAGWSYHTADRAIDELIEQELVMVERRRPPRSYRLVGETPLGGPTPLTPPEALM